MKKAILFLLSFQVSLTICAQIIADHRIVDRFDDIPQYYLNEVKKMWVTIPGQSHAEAYLTGALLLEQSYPAYAVSVVWSGTPEAYTTSNLRLSGATWGDLDNATGWQYQIYPWDLAGGEPYAWTYNPTQAARVETGISYAHANNLTIAAMAYGYCYNEGYYLSYVTAFQRFMDYCIANGLPTKIFFTTGPVDGHLSEATDVAYESSQRWVYIRNHVAADETRILFDYADILSYNDAGELQTQTWNGHIFPVIHPDNMLGGSGGWATGHIGGNGDLRIGKALWWMLARMAGWDGGPSATVPVTSITVAGQGGATTISTDGGTLQMLATVLPSNATNKTVTWSITAGSAYGTINSSTGVLTAVENGTVTIRATATDGSNVYGSTNITITNQTTPVSNITVAGQGGATTVSTDGGALQMLATVLPSNATNKTVTWSITNGSAYGTINSSTGLLTAIDNGSVTVRATAADGSGVFGTTSITISNQVIPVTSISISGGTAITTDGGTLQLNATVLPANATNKTVTWSITSGSAYATINSSTGLLTAVENGSVTIKTAAADGSGAFGTTTVTISNQVIPVSSITVSGGSAITTDGGTLQLIASVLPANATNKTVTWSITSGSAYATINSSTGLLTAVDNGSVTLRAIAADGSGIYGTTTVTISNQVIPVTSITVSGAGGVSLINSIGGTLQLSASILPANATNQTVSWTISNGTGQATINSSGVVTSVSNGTVTTRATANDGSGVFGTMTITISTQIIPVSSITISGGTAVTTDGGSLQLTASVLPANATNKTVAWSITSGTEFAAINSSSGLLTAVDNGSVTVRATAADGSGIYGTTTVTISNQVIPVTSITLAGTGGATAISTDEGTLQMVATVLPMNATNKTVAWSITSGSSYGTINSSTGVLTAIDNGTVTVRATATDGSNVYGSATITITNQTKPPILVTSITVTGTGGVTAISTDGGTLQMLATVSPSNATNKTVTWSITGGSTNGTINSSTGVLTAVDNGSVTVRATATDGSTVTGSTSITITGQTIPPIPITSISVTGQAKSTTISSDGGILQLMATILPLNATNQSVTWSISGTSGQASISQAGLVTAISDGTVTATATANDGSGVTGTMDIEIIGNPDNPLIIIVHENEMRIPIDESLWGCRISVYNLYGRMMSSKLVDSNLCIFDISSFYPGLYIAVLSGKIILKVAKVIIP
jgi:uncharacterized protein YjdB